MKTMTLQCAIYIYFIEKFMNASREIEIYEGKKTKDDGSLTWNNVSNKEIDFQSVQD